MIVKFKALYAATIDMDSFIHSFGVYRECVDGAHIERAYVLYINWPSAMNDDR